MGVVSPDGGPNVECKITSQEYIMEKIRNEVTTAYYVRHVFACVEKH